MAQYSGVQRHIARPFALFVIVGSVTLIVWLGKWERYDSRAQFMRLAETNADFIKSSNYPTSQQTATSLSEILKLAVIFRHQTNLAMPSTAPFVINTAEVLALPQSPNIVDMRASREAIVLPISEGIDAIFIRQSPPTIANFTRWSTIVPLIIFWTLSLLLAKFISQNLVRPLHALASCFSGVEHLEKPSLPFPGSERDDEIGHLARTLTQAHENLQAERSLREQSEKLALLGKVATGLAHEIRNPVTAVIMHAQLLKAADIERETATLIEGEAQKIESLVTQWMFLARPEPPNIRFDDMRNLILNEVAIMRAQCEHAVVDCKVSLPHALPCEVDTQRISQALRNILMNSIQAMPNGGDLSIDGEIAGDDVVVTVGDSGSGFSEEALTRIGDLFYSTKEGGMGVGLNVAYEVVKAHGGTIQAANRPEGGARLTITLPTKAMPSMPPSNKIL